MLAIQNIHFTYGNKPVLSDLSLSIPDGEIHGILGPNGSGKTTFFRLVTGWLKPHDGSIAWQGQPLSKRQTAFLETEPYFYPYLKGMEYLRLIRDAPEQIEKWNQLLDLPLEELTDNYSTGMQKKLAFLGTLLQERPVLILDEPFNGVDYAGNEVMMAIIRRQGVLKGATLISSHILSTLTHVCSRISLLGNGKILQTFEREDFAALEAGVREETGILLDKIMEAGQE